MASKGVQRSYILAQKLKPCFKLKDLLCVLLFSIITTTVSYLSCINLRNPCLALRLRLTTNTAAYIVCTQQVHAMHKAGAFNTSIKQTSHLVSSITNAEFAARTVEVSLQAYLWRRTRGVHKALRTRGVYGYV